MLKFEIDIKEIIKDYALGLGFSLFGVAEAVPLVKESERFKSWLDNKYHGMMKSLERTYEMRADVEKVLPGAKSVIVVAYNYFSPFGHPPDCESQGWGKISKYSWGEDYHEVILSLLKSLEEKITELCPGAESFSFIDNSPVMEKQWAVRAGIGWQGKNGLVITREFGSWNFLGVILTTLELQPDQPVKDYCGVCTRCIDTCPTHAIIAPKIIDATKCISYWTLESKPVEKIPQEMSENFCGWICGCDTCQEVCPWNKFQQPSRDRRFYPITDTYIDLKKINKMDDEELSDFLKNSSLKRMKPERLRKLAL